MDKNTAYELANDLAFMYIEGDMSGKLIWKIQEILRHQQKEIEDLKLKLND